MTAKRKNIYASARVCLSCTNKQPKEEKINDLVDLFAASLKTK